MVKLTLSLLVLAVIVSVVTAFMPSSQRVLGVARSRLQMKDGPMYILGRDRFKVISEISKKAAAEMKAGHKVLAEELEAIAKELQETSNNFGESYSKSPSVDKLMPVLHAHMFVLFAIFKHQWRLLETTMLLRVSPNPKAPIGTGASLPPFIALRLSIY
jgi:hypothetical protein